MDDFETVISQIPHYEKNPFLKIVTDESNMHFQIDFPDEYPDVLVFHSEFSQTEEFFQDAINGKLDFSKKLHTHNCFLLVYVYQGKNLEVVEGKPFIMTEQDLLLISPGATCYSVHPQTSQVYLIHLSSFFVYHIALPALSENILFSDFFSTYPDHQKKMLFFSHCMDVVSDTLFRLIREYVEQRPLYQSALRSTTCLLLIELIRWNMGKLIDFSGEGGGRMREILDYLVKNYTHISLSDLSREFHYNPSYLSEMIKKYTGKNFTQLISDYRLERAVSYIREGNLTINEIAAACGYRDHSSFYKAFKKKYRCTPKQYSMGKEEERVRD